MTTMKKTYKSKFVSKDLNELLDESQFFKNSPKPKKTQKRLKNVAPDNEDLSKLMEMYPSNSKKQKIIPSVADYKDSRLKLMSTIESQLNSRMQGNNNLLNDLSEVVTQLEADHEALRENEKKLEHVVNILVKCVQQASTSQRECLKNLKDIQSSYKQKIEEQDKCHRAETVKLVEELEEDMNKLQQKLISETKRKQFENLRRTIFQFQNDF